MPNIGCGGYGEIEDAAAQPTRLSSDRIRDRPSLHEVALAFVG
jgi:hypothetical protein